MVIWKILFYIDIKEKPERVKRLRIKKHRRRKSKPVHKWTQKEIYIKKNKTLLPPMPGKQIKNIKNVKISRKVPRRKSVKVNIEIFHSNKYRYWLMILSQPNIQTKRIQLFLKFKEIRQF